MNEHLRARGEISCKEMRVGISAQQEDLEEEHAGGPDCRCPAEPGQDISRDDGLDLKQEKGTEKNG